MKKILTSVLTLVLVLCGIIITGCSSERWNPYITVEGLKTEYEVGDTLDLTSAKIIHYAEETETEHAEIPLKQNMITGFSTKTTGTFTMIIIYEDLAVTVEYVVYEKGSQGGNNDDQGGNNNDGDHGFADGNLTETQANTILNSAINNMCNYAQIREDMTTSMWGTTSTTYQIVTSNTRYYYEDNDNRNWLVNQAGALYFYEIKYDVFDGINKYNKYVVNDTTTNDVRIYQYSEMKNGTFSSASKSGKTYTLVYIYENLAGSYETTIVIEDNRIKTTSTYISSFDATMTTQFTYYTYSTNSIPSIPQNVQWVDGGIYFEL